MDKVYFKKLKETAKIPKRATGGSCGYDITACIDKKIIINPSEHKLIKTGLAMQFNDKNFACFVFPRSGLAVKNGINLINCVGVIDSDYRGEIMVGLKNNSNEPFTVENGERIAQLVFMPVSLPETVEADKLNETQRGAGGFGSTGAK